MPFVRLGNMFRLSILNISGNLDSEYDIYLQIQHAERESGFFLQQGIHPVHPSRLLETKGKSDFSYCQFGELPRVLLTDLLATAVRNPNKKINLLHTPKNVVQSKKNI